MHTILHIGAGQASELPKLLESEAERIILVEPNPELAERLRQRVAQYTQVTVVEAAVTSDSTNNRLHEYNLPEACSLHPATGLKAMFPGLKANVIHTVKTISPEQLVAEYGPQAGQPAMLDIQVPGEEHALVQTLIETDQLKQFSELRMNANPKSYYQGSVAAESTLNALVDYGYQIISENQQDPDWPSWRLTRSPLKDQIIMLQAENQALKSDTNELVSELKQCQEQRTQTEKELERLKSDGVNKTIVISEKDAQIKRLKVNAHQDEKQLKKLRRKKIYIQKQLSKQWQLFALKTQEVNDLRKILQSQQAFRGETQKAFNGMQSPSVDSYTNMENAFCDMATLNSADRNSIEPLTEEALGHGLTNIEFDREQQRNLSQKPKFNNLQVAQVALNTAKTQLIDEKDTYKQKCELQQNELLELTLKNEQLKQKLDLERNSVVDLKKVLSKLDDKFAVEQVTGTKLQDLEKEVENVSKDSSIHIDQKNDLRSLIDAECI